MSFNPKVASHNFELQSIYKERIEKLGNLQGHTVSASPPSSDKVSEIVSSQKEVVFPRLSNDSWEKVAEFLDPTALKTWITTLTTAINPTSAAYTLELIQKLKALLLGINHGLNKKKVWALIPQCGSYITKLNLKGLNFNAQELGVIVKLCPKLREIEIDKLNEKNLFELLQECGQYVKTLDLSKLSPIQKDDMKQEDIKRMFQLCPRLSAIKTENLRILDDLMKDKEFLKKINREINDIYHKAFIEYLKTENSFRSFDDFKLIKKELMENLTLCNKIREINIPIVSGLIAEEVKTLISNCPHLIKLNLQSRRFSVDDLRTIFLSCQELVKLDLSHFPYIHERLDCIPHIHECLDCIPRTLKELSLKNVELTDDLIRQLPTGLTHLAIKLNVSSNILSRFTSLEVLEIEVSGQILDSQYKLYRVHKLKGTPQPFFTSRRDFFKYLPSGLKELNIRSVGFHQLDISQFPKSLQNLSVDMSSSLDEPMFIQSDGMSIPASLTSVKITSSPNSNDIRALPQTLKSLTISTNHGRLGNFHCFPRDLEELTLINIDFEQILELKYLENLPSRLKNLFFTHWFTNRFSKNFWEHDLSEAFPSRGKQLKIAIKPLIQKEKDYMDHNKSAIDWCEKNHVTLIDE